ncbi:MAG: ABC transporter ATP-binding protein [Candidatus Aminicenantales bacterium]
MIEVHDLWKKFGGLAAIRGVNLSVGQGEVMVVFGPNGAGKSTLINILSTTMKSSAGKAILGGFNLKDNALKIREIIGVVSHQTFLYDDLTAIENLSFYARMFNIDNREQRIQEVLQRIRLYSRRNNPVGSYSRGMQQRLAIARAILHDPSIILFDEPFTGLDNKACKILMELINEWKEDRKTILLTTHNLEKGLEIGQKFIILYRGEVVFSTQKDAGEFPELADQYQQWIEKQGE